VADIGVRGVASNAPSMIGGLAPVRASVDVQAFPAAATQATPDWYET